MRLPSPLHAPSLEGTSLPFAALNTLSGEETSESWWLN